VLYLLRHLLSVLILPTTVVLFVPMWIARRYHVSLSWPDSPGDIIAVGVGVLLLVIGLTLFGASLLHFFREGRGTLAPWDPPRRLVVRGPYQYVRNPMISGVIFIVLGTACALRSSPHATWAAIFFAINAVYIPLLEEPDLAHRFGEEYRRYCAHVPRLIPRSTPWRPDDTR
jgi:protein-S-isoprenylcysteine O-methyltransferase Ste14